MKATIYTENDQSVDVDINCSPEELLIIYKSLRYLSESKNVDDDDRRKAQKMFEEQPRFCERRRMADLFAEFLRR